MGSISEAIIEMTEAEVTRKVKKAFSKRLMKLIDDKVLTISEAAEVLDISEEEFKAYIE